MFENIERDELTRLSAYAPRSLDKNDVKNSSGIFQRYFPLCFAIGMHGLFLWWLDTELRLTSRFIPEQVITILEFLDPEPKPAPVIVMPDIHVPINSSHASANLSKSVSQRAEPTLVQQFNKTRKTELSLSLYDDTGRIRLPVDFIEKLDEGNTHGKRFDFLNPDLELAGTWLKRPPAMEFNPTQFEDAWKPDQDILNELIDKAVEKTTKEVRIPVPGNPTVKLVCVVSVLALGGGCGFVPNGGYGRVIADNEDDPNTLSPEEDKQCQAWWEKISNTRSQREWLKTKELYEITCKKPLAKEKVKAPQGH